MNLESWTRNGRRSGHSEHANDSRSAADTPQYTRSIYRPPTARYSNPSGNASNARTRVRFPKSCLPVDTRESVEKLSRPIVRQSCPTVETTPHPPLSSRTSFVEWLGAESNRRHVDFQSTALPTELPSRDDADCAAPWGVHYATNPL